jgi:two-component system sensor histidine kinase TctE
MLHELVANLVDNALRYTPGGGIVTAVVITSQGVNLLRIADNGPGIPPDERERVFERFYRLHSGGSDGCGLGLPIVREIAMASGAEVRLSDAPVGTGLVVTVTFAARPAIAPATSADRTVDTLTTE